MRRSTDGWGWTGARSAWAHGALLCTLAACTTPEPLPPVATHVDDWRDEVLYQVVVDRFENGDPGNDDLDGVGVGGALERHQGGDWAGLESRLDYIQGLGATALWISPIVANVDRTESEDGYHGYWASDFTELNPRFGGPDDLRRLVRAAHDRSMLVVVDVVTNHAGRVFGYDLDRDGAVSEGEVEPPFLDAGYDVPLVWSHRPRLWRDDARWTLEASHFHRRGDGNLGDPHERVFGDFPTGLRDLDTEQAELRDALVETYARWATEFDLDGFRIDAVPHVETDFWATFGREIRARLSREGKDRFLLLGEVFSGDPSVLARYSDDEGALDGAFDFALKFGVVDAVLLDGGAPATARGILEGSGAYRPFGQPGGVGLSPWQARVAIADNHDTWRIRGELDRFESVALALLLVTTVDAIPCIYYGTEQAFRGMGGAGSRERMWESGFRTDGETYQWLHRLLELRASREVLRRGSLTVRYASENDGFSDAPDAGLLAYERALGDERMLIVLNAHALQSSAAVVPSGFAAGTRLVDVLGGGEAEVGAGGAISVALGPRGAAMYEPR